MCTRSLFAPLVPRTAHALSLVTPEQVADLTASLRYLYLFFNARHRYPVGAPIWGSNLDEQRIATPATHASGPRHGTVVFHDYLTASHVAAWIDESPLWWTKHASTQAHTPATH